jgi:hypothetical protein
MLYSFYGNAIDQDHANFSGQRAKIGVENDCPLDVLLYSLVEVY